MTSMPDIDAVRAEYLRRMTCGSGALLRQVEAYCASRKGKMLRPRLTLLAADTLDSSDRNPQRTLLAATCVEMLHNASLLHDDVIDNDSTRRGQPSVNTLWNNKVAILVGDYHLVQVMRLLDEMDEPDAARMVNSTVEAMVEAELLAMEDTPTTKERYLRIIDGKTARLFATACALGNPAYEDFGLHYGRLFQLHDDIDDNEATPWTAQLLEEENAALNEIKYKLPIQNI